MVTRDGASPARRFGTARAALLLAALVAVAFWDVLFAGRTLSPAPYVPGVLPSGPVGSEAPPPTVLRDLDGGAWVDQPAPYLVHRPLAALHLPLWNPDVGLGAPLAANPNMAAWSPLQLAVNLWPTPLVQDLAWVLRVYLLGLFTWLLASALGCGFWAAMAAATAIALSGQTLDWVVHQPLNTDVFVPAAIAAALWTWRGVARARIALVLAIAAALLGVKPQSAIVGALFGVLVLAACALDERRSGRPGAVRGTAWIVAAALAGLALAACALLPFVESYAAASGLVRAGRTAQSEWTRPLATLPGLAGGWALRLFAGAGAATQDGPPHAGATVLLLAALGFWRARRRALAWVLAATVVLSVARIFGLLPVPLAGVPVLGSVSFVKYCFPLYLALALLAALALDARPARPSRNGAGGALVAAAGACAIAAELLWLGVRAHPPRIDPYAPAPYVSALSALTAESGGRITGPVSLAPPLVSGVLGFRDLRAIDVLTPRDGYDFVAQQVAASEGLTWILADPDPLIAATSPGADVANLRWILSRGALDAARLPVAARSAVSGHRLMRLFDVLDSYHVDTAALGGGIRELGADRRFHWSCATPCRFTFVLQRVPERFAAGFAAPSPVRATISMALATASREHRSGVNLELGPGRPWQDLWVEAPPDTSGRAVVVIEVRSDAPATVDVGGVGPGPGKAAEEAETEAELHYRERALARLRPRYADATAHIVENPGALGEAYVATDVARARDVDEIRACLVAHESKAVACVADPAAFPTPSADAPSTARVVASGDDALTIDVAGPAAALLVVSRLDFPGWQASLDATSVPIARVNGAMMGIVVPPGGHRIELSYRPRSLRVGAALSLCAVLVLVAARRRFEGHGRRR